MWLRILSPLALIILAAAATAAPSFAPAVNSPVTMIPETIFGGDLDADGRADVVVMNSNVDYVQKLFGTGTAALSAPQQMSTSLLQGTAFIGSASATPSLRLLFAGISYPSGLPGMKCRISGPDACSYGLRAGPSALAFANLSGYGPDDLLMAESDSGDIVVYLFGGLNYQGCPEFGTSNMIGGAYPSGYVPTGGHPVDLAVADLNGDGKPDFVAANSQEGTVAVCLGQGRGAFSAAVPYPVGDTPVSVAAADLNGDGRPDLAVANRYSNTVSILLNSGDGTFTPGTDLVTRSQPVAVKLVDIDGDGLADLEVACYGAGVVSVFPGRGDGTFAAPVHLATAAHPVGLLVQDVNGDLTPDLVTASASALNVSVLLNTSGGFSCGGAASCQPPQDLHCGGVQRYTFTVTNLGGSPVSYAYSLDDSLGWIAGSDGPLHASTPVLAPQASFTRWIDVRCPDGLSHRNALKWVIGCGASPPHGDSCWVRYQSLACPADVASVGGPAFLAPPTPNPSREGVSFACGLPADADVSLGIFDALGRRVRELRRGRVSAGQWTQRWDGRADDGRRVATGEYFIRFQAGDRMLTRRFLVVR